MTPQTRVFPSVSLNLHVPDTHFLSSSSGDKELNSSREKLSILSHDLSTKAHF